MSVETKPEIKSHLSPEERKRILDEAFAIQRKAMDEGKIEVWDYDRINAELGRKPTRVVILSYPDTGVYIRAWHTRNEPESEALAYLYDTTRVFVASRFIVLETLAKATYNGRREEIAFYERLFSLVTVWAPNDDSLLDRAIELASTYDIMNLDALHVASAERAGVQEFVTTEKTGKPLYRATNVGPVFLGDL